MTRRILWINPAMNGAYDQAIGDSLREEARPDTRLDVVSLAGEGPQHLEYNAYELIAAKSTLETILWGQQQGYDAAVIGCFYDPFIRAAKELTTTMAVTAPAEACLRIAMSVGERVSILVGRQKWIPEMAENVHKYGVERNFAGFRSLQMGVPEFQLDPAVTEKRIREQADRAIEEDGADGVVLGCTIEFGFFRRLQSELGVPVIDATVAPLLWAELLADANRHQGWLHSGKLGYGTPDPDEVDPILGPVEPVVSRDPRP